MGELLSGLTDNQREAVTAPLDTAMRVLATAGAGKTRVIACRYAYLVQNGVNPNEIVAVTFSKVMADELLSRIQKYTPNAVKEQICTIHALCYRILKAEGDKRQVAKEWQIKQAIQEAAKSFDLDAGWQEIQWWIDRSKMYGYSADSCLDYFVKQNSLKLMERRKLAAIRAETDKTLWRQELVTFQDMLLDVELALRNDMSFLSKWQSRFGYVILDECQDTSAQAYFILSTLAAPQDRFVAVGDDSQLMYRFSGATPEANLFEGFEQRFPSGITIMLDTNFRSTEVIVNTSTALIAHNYQGLGGPYDQKYEKAAKARVDAPVGNPVEYIEHDTPEDEARWLVTEVERLSSNGVSFGDIFVAARTRAQLAFLESPLVRSKIPFLNLCGGSFWKSKHIACVVAYLSLAIYGDDDSFALVYDVASKNMRQPFDTPSRRKGEYSPNRWLGGKFLDACNGSYVDRTRALYSSQGWRWRQGLDDLDDMVAEVQDSLVDGLIFTLETIIDHYKAYLSADGIVGVDAAEDGRLDDLESVLAIASEFDSPDSFLEHVSSCQEAAKDDSWDGKVVISTIHRLKGLEREVVFGVGLSEGLLPHRSALGQMPQFGKIPTGEPSRLEDERCIAFVLVSRAKSRVYLSSIKRWKKQVLSPSRFLNEMAIQVEYA